MILRTNWFLALLVLAPSVMVAFYARDNDEVLPGLRAAVNEVDSLALVALYHSTGGPEWTNDANWLSGPVDSWFGITVADGRVTRIELADNDLKNHTNFGPTDGTIPPEIGDLLQLQVLDLQSNAIVGAVPTEMANLINLEHLHLNDNALLDLPDLSALGALTTLSVENNFLTFEDLEPNVSLGFTFTYVPQAIINTRRKTGFEGDSVALHVPVGGLFNRYLWYKDGVALAGAMTDTYVIESMTESDAGSYELEITNTLVADLTLKAEPIPLSFDKRFTAQWLDIGAYHHAYAESGARHEGAGAPEGMEYPAILRHSGHIRARAFWIGVKDWTDAEGLHYPYYVARVGPRDSGFQFSFPIQNKLIGRYEDTVVEVNGMPSFDNEAILDEVDPSLAADRMLHNIHTMTVGITTNRKIYAYTNQFHDDYHIIEYEYCNTGNTGGDAQIELPNQTLHDVIFFRSHRWRGSEQAAWATSSAQVWGRYTVHDVVGDGHEQYPVDFTAQYAWMGWDIASSSSTYSNLGSSLFADEHETIAPGDSIGRLAGATMVGRSTIHADRSATDASYDRGQPAIMAWMSNDDALTADGAGHEDYYELGIVAPDLIDENSACTDCTRAYPHFAERNRPGGEFWNPPTANTLTGRIAGGFSPTTGYGPYEMAPGECVNVVVSEGIAGLSFDAATKIGRAYKRGGPDRETDLIEYDANGDGVINTTPFDYDNIFVGTEAQTKNQWVMTARDSLFQLFFRARDLYTASQRMTVYPIPEPPRAPVRFSLWGREATIDLEWTPASGGPAVDRWELYRADRWEDNLYGNGCLDDISIQCGYELVASLPAETTAYTDTDVLPGTDYYYYLEGIGEPQPVDPNAITGTPYGLPLRSSRYLTQTYTQVSLQTSTPIADEAVPKRFTLEANYPNPFNTATTIRYALPQTADVELVVYDILGRKVAVLVQQRQGAGRHEAVFQASGRASGVYVYVLRAGEQRTQRMMLLVR